MVHSQHFHRSRLGLGTDVLAKSSPVLPDVSVTLLSGAQSH